MKQELLASGMREPGRRAYGGAVVWLFLLDGTCDGCPSLLSASLPSKVVVKVSVKRSYSSCMRLLAASLTACASKPLNKLKMALFFFRHRHDADVRDKQPQEVRGAPRQLVGYESLSC
jgi:hypothetical protein